MEPFSENKDQHRKTEKIPRRRKIFLRTLLLSWLIIIFTVIIFVFAIIPYQKAQLQNEMEMQAGVVFSSVSQIAENSIILEDYSAIVDHCLTLIQNNTRVMYVVITRHDGFSLIHTATQWLQKTLSKEWLPKNQKNSETGRFVKSELVNQEVYSVSFPFRYSGIDWGWIHIGLAPGKFYSDLKSLYIRILLTSILAISLGMVASFYFARRISTPIMMLDQVAKRIRSGDLSARAMIRSGDEVESLADSFNRTAEHLKTEITEKEAEIRERRAVESALRESEERYRTIIESIEDGYYEIDNNGIITFANEVMGKITEYPVNELIGMNSRHLIGEANRKQVFKRFAGVYLSDRPVSVFGLEIIRKDEENRQIETSISLIRNLTGEKIGFRGVARDVNERKKQEDKLIYIAYHDTLTGLKNRKWFYEKLRDLIHHAKRYQYQIALLYIDIDHFKKVNDAMGHEVGDRLLQLIAERLRNCLRRTDTIARIGGDEFSVLLDNPTEDILPEAVAEKIVDALGKPYYVQHHTIDFISASIGISSFPEDADDLESLVRRADTAMYQAKEKGNCHISCRH
ncbi:MAG: diguanylate cyclase [Desulfobacteraceae bacterium]|nr:MAG: diguanylate cyclase [Desulfobacteraceae bacterium]